jgi:hypothetical protein
MKRIFLRISAAVVFILICLAADTITAMDWPYDSINITQNFGWNNRGKPVLGIFFEGENEVFAVEKGEVIFSRRSGETVSRLPSPLGSWTAVDHGDGLISIYSRHDDENLEITQVEKNETVVMTGTSGWSGQNGVYFMLYDRRDRRWINPEMIITPIRNSQPPQILSVSLHNAEGHPINNTQMRNINQGRYTIIVSTAIAGTREAMFAPYRIVCSINGAEAGTLIFETFSARDGILMASRNGFVPAKQVYANFPAFEAAEVFFNRGQASLEIIVQDIAGNSHRTLVNIIVN